MNITNGDAGNSAHDPSDDGNAERIRERNTWLEQQLDPGGTLPQVDIRVTDGRLERTDGVLTGKDEGGVAGYMFMYLPGSEDIIGDVNFARDPSLGDKLVITDAGIVDEARHKGYGPRLYLEALKALPAGYGVVCHSMLSLDGEHAWQRLIQAGVAQPRQEPASGQLGKYETTF